MRNWHTEPQPITGCSTSPTPHYPASTRSNHAFNYLQSLIGHLPGFWMLDLHRTQITRLISASVAFKCLSWLLFNSSIIFLSAIFLDGLSFQSHLALQSFSIEQSLIHLVANVEFPASSFCSATSAFRHQSHRGSRPHQFLLPKRFSRKSSCSITSVEPAISRLSFFRVFVPLLMSYSMKLISPALLGVQWSGGFSKILWTYFWQC